MPAWVGSGGDRRPVRVLALTSTLVPAAEITARLGIEPDEIVVRGSRQADPARPARHRWKVACRKPGLTVDDQITRVVDRLFGHAEAANSCYATTTTARSDKAASA
ncbi:DUF4279 domain-containing protein [Micromonospora sp. IBHARD004]|uniref:DUF4279 domain-containing protein n=1 Tax=Micromonospora sp. IBHARD004 TaxID=3457764 RepID=UPI004058B187